MLKLHTGLWEPSVGENGGNHRVRPDRAADRKTVPYLRLPDPGPVPSPAFRHAGLRGTGVPDRAPSGPRHCGAALPDQ